MLGSLYLMVQTKNKMPFTLFLKAQNGWKNVLKLLAWIFMFSWIGLNPRTSKSKIYHWIFEKTHDFCFGWNYHKLPKKWSKRKKDTTFTYKKPAATPTFCKCNLFPSLRIWVMNFLSWGENPAVQSARVQQ